MPYTGKFPPLSGASSQKIQLPHIDLLTMALPARILGVSSTPPTSLTLLFIPPPHYLWDPFFCSLIWMPAQLPLLQASSGAPIALVHSIQHPCLPLFLSLKALQGLSIVLDLQVEAPLHSQALLQHWPTGLLSRPLSAHDLLASALTGDSLPSTLLLANSISEPSRLLQEASPDCSPASGSGLDASLGSCSPQAAVPLLLVLWGAPWPRG